jgi:DNA-binding transcriptional LysR family regulator
VDLRQFRYFVAVAEELHFSRAAERLHIGQPPLSLQIQAIEQELGVMLLKRSRRRVELTEAGRVFLVEARAALAQAAHAVETAKRAASGHVGALSINFTTSAPLTSVFSRAIRAYHMAFPDVHLQLRIATSQATLDALALRKLDVGLIRPAAQAAMPAGLTAVPVYRERLMLVLPADHPLADLTAPVPGEALADEKFVLRARGTGAGFYEQVFQICAQAGFTPNVVQDAAETTTTLGLVAAGLGLSIMPASVRTIALENVVWRELAVGEEAVTSLLLVFNEAGENNQPRDHFIRIVKEIARQVESGA